MLSLATVKSVIESDLDPRIKWAREMNNKLLLHVEGIGLQESLADINGYENSDQREARKKHAISNKFITEELLRPTDNAFNARGGSKYYKFSANEDSKKRTLVKKLSTIKNSHSLDWYIRHEWFNKFITDPNGLIVIESETADVHEKDRDAYPTYKSIQSIRAYEQNGSFVDWVVFEPHEVIEKDGRKVKVFWALDEQNWYLIHYKDEIYVRDIIKHGFDRVPAVLCSDIVDNVVGWKKSPIDAQVELLNKYMVSTSVNNIAEFFHNYPQQWMFADKCPKCNGTGNTGTNENFIECSNDQCNNGRLTKKDVTDINYIKIPESHEEPLLKEPGGYMHMPVDSAKLMVQSIDRTWNRIFFSHWGTVVSREGKNETATGRFIDAQPVNNRLAKYTKSIETTHTILANFLGAYYFPLTFDKAFIQYGKRYLIETPDQIWEKYLDAKTQKAPISTLDILLNQYLESEFGSDEEMLAIEIKKSKLEPFVHWSIDIVRSSEEISAFDKKAKEYFGEWINTLELIDFKESLENLSKKRDEYITNKIKNEEKLQETLRKKRPEDSGVHGI